MGFESKWYRAVGSRVDRNLRGKYLLYRQLETPKDAENLAQELNAAVRQKKRDLGLNREHKGAYGQSYPDVRTRPAQEKAKEDMLEQEKTEPPSKRTIGQRKRREKENEAKLRAEQGHQAPDGQD